MHDAIAVLQQRRSCVGNMLVRVRMVDSAHTGT
jgi:hypothetical protein